MSTTDYQIVFEKLAAAAAEAGLQEAKVTLLNLSPEEVDEIDELRRLSLELQNPEPQSYTTT